MRICRGWRNDFAKRIVAHLPRLWDPAYDGELHPMAHFLGARIEGVMTDSGSPFDCDVSFEFVPIESINVRNPDREAIAKNGYPRLQELLEMSESYNSVPIVCAQNPSGYVVWDGHRRLRTYGMASRQMIPSLVARFRGGEGNVYLVTSLFEGL